MDAIVALCRRRGFIFQSSEIYGGIGGFWDYGPLGVLLKNNIRDRWWRDMVLAPPIGPDGRALDIVGLDCAIISHPKVWEASGHVAGFADPMQDCRHCKARHRADQVWPLLYEESEWVKSLRDALGDGPVSVAAITKWIGHKGKKLAPGLLAVRDPSTLGWVTRFDEHPPADRRMERLLELLAGGGGEPVIPCPVCGGPLTEPRQFNLMFQTYIGALADEESRAYLRPETAQGMFYNFRNVLDTTRVKVPFGLAQLGKGFRNEITPRNFIFRSREFEMMEVEFFVHPSEANDWYQFWRKTRYEWWQSLGLAGSNLRLRDHERDELAHYARDNGGCADVEYAFPFSGEKGFSELEGIAYRSNFDLTQHQNASGANLEYFDQERGERYLPHVIEPAAGLTRGLLAVLCEAYTPDPSRPSQVYMRFHPSLAPIKAGVFPLVNKDGMPEIAEKLYQELRGKYPVEIDVKQSIGKRYARMDEAGTPYCFTIDGQTLQDQTVTVRYRDTATQERIGLDGVSQFLADHMT
ncbi:MAG: glycine--tRNA ligase [Candidatus Binatia bacterium]